MEFIELFLLWIFFHMTEPIVLPIRSSVKYIFYNWI